MRVTIARVLGLVALCAAARAAWLHHQDMDLLRRTDWQREAFAAGQAVERARAKAEADASRQAAYFGPSPMPDWLLPTAKELAEKWPNPWTSDWRTLYDPGPPPTLTVLPPDVDGVVELDFVERDLGPEEAGGRDGSGDDAWWNG